MAVLKFSKSNTFHNFTITILVSQISTEYELVSTEYELVSTEYELFSMESELVSTEYI